MQPRLNSFDHFLSLFRRELLGRQRPLRVTCRDRDDGAGAQAHTMIAAMTYARHYGHVYVHTPFGRIGHAERPMAEWVAAWEQLFNLGEGEEIESAEGSRALNYSAFHPRLYYALMGGVGHIRRPGASNAGGYFQPYFYGVESSPERYRAVIPELRRKYFRGQVPKRGSSLEIAVHVRRGDVTATHGQRHTAIEQVVEKLRHTLAVLDELSLPRHVAVYSQGGTAGLEGLRRLGADLRLDIDAIATMRQLIEADVLLMSKSSFSYVAALISDGVKLYEPFWHAPLPEWIECDRRGRFDRRELKDALASRAAANPAPRCDQPAPATLADE